MSSGGAHLADAEEPLDVAPAAWTRWPSPVVAAGPEPSVAFVLAVSGRGYLLAGGRAGEPRGGGSLGGVRRREHDALERLLHPSPSSEPRSPRFTDVSFLLKFLDLLLDIESGKDRECLAELAQTDYFFSCREAVLTAEPSL